MSLIMSLWPQMLVTFIGTVVGGTGIAAIDNKVRKQNVALCAKSGFIAGLFGGVCSVATYVLVKVLS